MKVVREISFTERGRRMMLFAAGNLHNGTFGEVSPRDIHRRGNDGTVTPFPSTSRAQCDIPPVASRSNPEQPS
jgi:hypothetical protein